MPLLWRIFVGNAIVLGVATTGLVLTPVTVSFPAAEREPQVRGVRSQVDRRGSREAQALPFRARRPAREHRARRRAGRLPDLQLAEVFVHRRVLIVPVTEGRRVTGIVTRSDLFAALAQRFLEGT